MFRLSNEKILNLFRICLFSYFALSHPLSADQGDWDDYYEKTLDASKPQPTLSMALKKFETDGQDPGLAVDLGTGTGRDALYLLNQGWSVLALDAEPLSIQILLNRVPEEQKNRLDAIVSPFSMMNLPDQIDLINASYSLPFCAPEDFPGCWQNIVDHLAIGGRFAGQLFGDRDEWASSPDITSQTEEQMLQLFQGHFEIEYLQIEEKLEATAAGSMKHWHVFHIVAKKIR